MVETPPFCRFPSDPDGWSRALVQVWREDSWTEHCVLEGLQADCAQCVALLLEGVSASTTGTRGSNGEGREDHSLSRDLATACEAVVLRGYHSGLRAARRIFYDAYHKAVRFGIHKFGFTSGSQPADDDVLQEVFLGLHNFFRRGGGVRPGCLSGFVWQSAVNACRRAIGRKYKEPRKASDVETPATADAAEYDWVDLWEDFDRQLGLSGRGHLINRVVLAHMCLEGRSTGRKGPIDELLADWRRLGDASEDELRSLHEQVTSEVQHNPQQGPVRLAAEMTESGVAEPWQIALILAAAAGLDLDETRQHLGRLKGLSANAVSTRRSRIYDAMALPQSKD